jgi:hypothetical protein
MRYRLLNSLFVAGAVWLLLIWWAVALGWLPQAWYGLYAVTGLAGLVVIVGLIALLKERKRMIQLQHMSQLPVPTPSASLAEVPETLSKEEARVWLDEFLVEQQQTSESKE